MTETEAKTKWCPMARSAVHDGANRWVDPDGTKHITQCIGSACMMWREYSSIPQQRPHFEPGMGYGTLTIIPGIQKQGYCGFAGHPEPGKALA